MSGRRNRGTMSPPPARAGRRNQDFFSQPLPSGSRRSQPQFASQTSGLLDQSQADDSEVIENSATSAVKTALRLASNGKPFKRSDLLHGCLTKKRNQIEKTIILAQQKLKDVYGVELVEATPGKYIVVMPKGAPFREDLSARSGVAASPFSSMLGVVLTLIYIQKGRLSEEYLKNTMLPKLFPDIKTVPHPYFGNVDKLIQEFEQQAYITKETESRDNETIGFLKWGVRAEQEINKRSIVVPVMNAMFGGNIPHSLLDELET
uniref:Melanoma-associated antigen G1 n=1 Tax=Lygus hesperus TaxID=30085 RepID=A0A0A9XQM5_LYGHE